MPLSDILIISSIIASLVSIPFLVTGPLSDTIPTGKLVLSMDDDTEVEGIPSKMTKVFSYERFEKTYETAFGKFSMSISADEIKQELSNPSKVTIVNQDMEKTVWKITTNQYQFEIVRALNSINQTCITPDGELVKTMVVGKVSEYFQGVNQDYIVEVCAQAEQDLQEEVNKMEQIKSESEIPSTETKGNATITPTPSGGDIMINEFLPSPSGDIKKEWVELYNPTTSDVDIGNWIIDDEKDASVYQYIIPEGTTVNAGGFIVFNLTTNVLNNGGDEVRLIDDLGSLVDSYGYTTDPGYNKSIGRDPDGSDNWIVFDTPTYGEENS